MQSLFLYKSVGSLTNYHLFVSVFRLSLSQNDSFEINKQIHRGIIVRRALSVRLSIYKAYWFNLCSDKGFLSPFDVVTFIGEMHVKCGSTDKARTLFDGKSLLSCDLVCVAVHKIYMHNYFLKCNDRI